MTYNNSLELVPTSSAMKLQYAIHTFFFTRVSQVKTRNVRKIETLLCAAVCTPSHQAWVRSIYYVWYIWQWGLHEVSRACEDGYSIGSMYEGGTLFCNVSWLARVISLLKFITAWSCITVKHAYICSTCMNWVGSLRMECLVSCHLAGPSLQSCKAVGHCGGWTCHYWKPLH
jgi:hypothetical protein